MKFVFILALVLSLQTAFAGSSKTANRKVAADESPAAKLLAGHAYCIQVNGKTERGIYDVKKDGTSKDFTLIGEAKPNAKDDACYDAQVKWTDTGVTTDATFCSYPSDC